MVARCRVNFKESDSGTRIRLIILHEAEVHWVNVKSYCEAVKVPLGEAEGVTDEAEQVPLGEEYWIVTNFETRTAVTEMDYLLSLVGKDQETITEAIKE